MEAIEASSVLEESCAVALHCLTISHSEALIPSPLLCVRQIRVSISVRLCACWLNPKRQPLQRPNGEEKIPSPKSFSTQSIPEKTYSDASLFPSSCYRLSSQVSSSPSAFSYPSLSFYPRLFSLNWHAFFFLWKQYGVAASWSHWGALLENKDYK